MEKRTGKVALEITNGHFTFWKDVHFLFVSHCYRCSRHLACFFGSGQIYLKNSFLFYNFVTHDTPDRGCWLSLICKFKNVLLTYSQLGFPGFSFSIFLFFATVFRNIFSCSTLGVLNKYRVLNNTSNAKNTQYSVA